jgi:chromosome partitioning protein
MKVITLLNEKGGVGKTTLSTHIAAGLALRGRRVVLVDADPQGNATTAVGLDKQPMFYDLCVRNAAWKTVLRPVHPQVYSPPNFQTRGSLYVVTSNAETRNIANSIRSNAVIRARFQELASMVDYIVVDTSPTPSLLHEAITLASDYIIIPTDCEAFSALEGLPDSIAHTEVARQAAAQVGLKVAHLLAIIPNKFRPRTVGHNEVLKHLRQQYGALVWEPLQQAIVFSDAQLVGQFLYGAAVDSVATRQMIDTVDRIEREVNAHG